MNALIPRSVLADSSLSFAARGLYAVLATLDQHERSEAQLLTMQPNGKDRLRGALRELEAAGYLKRRWDRGASGRVRTMLWVLPTVDGEAV